MADLLCFEKSWKPRSTEQCHVSWDLNFDEKLIFGKGDFSEL
jgi:hypothetical protein